MQEEQNQLLHKIQTLFFRFAMWFEIAMSLVIFAGVIAQLRFLLQYLTGTEALGFGGFLQYLLEMLIGLEIIMMLCRHDLDSIVEVMIFAVTRTLLIMHERSLGMLIGIVAIAVLFAIRKYLFLSGEEAAARRRYSDHIQKDQ